MKLLRLKHVAVFIILLLSTDINKVQLNNGRIESGDVTLTKCFENESPRNNCIDLELKESESRQTNQAEKVETIVINRPLSKHSEVRLISLFTLREIVLSKKNSTLILLYYLLISKTPQISPLVDILRI